jgi:hypothetical protein
MKTRTRLALALSVIVVGLALASDSPRRVLEVLSCGTSDAAAGAVSLRATLGQPVVGLAYASETSLGHGFWHRRPCRTYLRLLMRSIS